MARNINISKYQLLGEIQYVEIEMLVEYDNTTLELCHTTYLSACNKAEETG